MANSTRITFVWNADFSVRGGLRALGDITRQDHSCTLCGIAYHTIRQTAPWKAMKAGLKAKGWQVKEPCRNQLSAPERQVAGDDYPTVLLSTSQGIKKLLTGAEIDSCQGEFNRFEHLLEQKLGRL